MKERRTACNMGRPKEPPAMRYRLKVPESDASVIAWMDAQSELSISLRLLIKEDIIRNGFTDVTCRPVGQLPKRGRPSNAEVELRESVPVMDDGDVEEVKLPKVIKTKVQTKTDVVMDEVEPEAQVETIVKPKVADAATESREDMITSMLSGGSRAVRPKASAASMGLLNDD